jgi:uncharacterized surface protein with fasciclin (FAS1) repeats
MFRFLVPAAVSFAVVATAPAARAQTIPEVAAKAGQFGTLLTAVKAAGLAETLSSKGPFTVFAPTDDAFKKLPKGTVEGLLKPENKKKLAAILTYHVVPAKILAGDIKKGSTHVKTVNGKQVAVKKNGGVSINGAKVITADVVADNGVIHVIDKVLLPK